MKDLRFAIRMLLKTPAFTLLAVAALALGIGANTAIFSVVDAVLLRELPFRDPDRLAAIWESKPANERNVVNPTNFLRWRERAQSFESMAAFSAFPVTVTGAGEPDRVPGGFVTPEFFRVLGVRVAQGRDFTAQEGLPQQNDKLIVTHEYWQRRLGGHAPDRKLWLESRPVTIVGVLPPGFSFPGMEADLFQPLALDPAREHRGRFLQTVARLRAGVSLARANEEMQAVYRYLSVDSHVLKTFCLLFVV
jgi:putative ABC transport system permease protein